MRSRTSRVLAMFLVLLFVTSAAEGKRDLAADWPQWRGPNRDAISVETGLLERWPDGGPPVVWSSSVGAGFSSVSVAGDRLFTLGDSNETQFLFCIDALTGEEIWRRELGAAFSNSYGDGPRSTPLIDGNTVFAIGTAGLLLAADRATGETVWQHDLVGEFGAELPGYGFASSPLVVGDKLVVEVGSARGAFMAFKKKNGKVAWSSQNDHAAYSSPIVATIRDAPQIVFWSASGLRAVSPRDGSLLWSYDSETLCPVTGVPLNTGTPIFLPPDRIFMASGSGATLLRVVKSGETQDVEVIWSTEQMRSDVNTAVLLGDYIYGFNRAILQCIDARTGEVRWRARGFERGSLIAADGKLIVLGESGNLALVEATPERFVQLDVAQVLKGKSWTAPSLAAGRLYLRNHDQLLCLDLRP